MDVAEEVRQRLNQVEDKPISENRFSQEYLGRSRSYLSVVKHYRKEVSDAALLSLYMHLKGTSENWAEMASISKGTHRDSAYRTQLFFIDLANLVWLELERRAG